MISVLHGICLCHKEWIKPEHRVDQHLAMFGVGEICPDCNTTIDWYAHSEGEDGEMRVEE